MHWFTSDTHFGHKRIIDLCKRPFKDVDEMDACLIDRINERVGVDDTLYHLGDLCHRGSNAAAYRSRIRCRRVVLVLGNHDPQTHSGQARPEFASLFDEVHSLLRTKVPVNGVPQLLVLCHYAMRVWDRAHYGAWHLYGHSHGSLPDDPHARSMDVGVDAHGYRPLSIHEIADFMAKKSFRPVDHHLDRGGERGSEAPKP